MFLRVILLVVVAGCLASPARSADRQVPSAYPTIQDALDACVEGDTVTVASGTYSERFDVPAIGLLVRSATGNAADCVLDGSAVPLADAEALVMFLSGTTARRELRGFTVREASAAVVIEIETEGPVSLRDCAFLGNGPWGTVNASGRSLEVEDCAFAGNEVYAWGAGLRVTGDATVRGCTFTDNRAIPFGSFTLTQGGAIFTLNAGGFEGSQLLVEDCTFERNHCTDYGGAIHLGSHHDATIRANIFRENEADACAGAIYLAFTARDVLIQDNLLVGDISPAGAAIGVHGRGSGAQINRNTVVDAVGAEAIRMEEANGTQVSSNVVVGSTGWGVRWLDSAGVSTCNLVWGNALGQNNQPGLLDVSLDPQFCDPAGGDYRVASTSPCLVKNHNCAEQRGAFGEGCATVPVEATSWGGLKTRFAGAPD